MTVIIIPMVTLENPELLLLLLMSVECEAGELVISADIKSVPSGALEFNGRLRLKKENVVLS